MKSYVSLQGNEKPFRSKSLCSHCISWYDSSSLRGLIKMPSCSAFSVKSEEKEGMFCEGTQPVPKKCEHMEL